MLLALRLYSLCISSSSLEGIAILINDILRLLNGFYDVAIYYLCLLSIYDEIRFFKALLSGEWGETCLCEYMQIM